MSSLLDRRLNICGHGREDTRKQERRGRKDISHGPQRSRGAFLLAGHVQGCSSGEDAAR